MDVQSVMMEYLSRVQLLQRLPSSSLYKLAQLILVKHYEKGEYVFKRHAENAHGDGAYFIFQGQADACAADDSGNQLQFKKYDYFAHGLFNKLQLVDVIASTKLTCLVLPLQHCTLLHPKSIWSADKTVDQCSLVERIMHIDPIKVDIFRGITLPDTPILIFGKVFGGQIMGQALAAASKTVGCFKLVHSLHVYYMLSGDVKKPITYEVQRVHDGKSFATRSINAIQKGRVIFTMLASFHKEEEGFAHQEVTMPSVPDPETLLSLEELRERYLRDPRLLDPRLPRHYRNKVSSRTFVPWPIEMKFCEPYYLTDQTKDPPRLIYWFRAKGKLSDDQALHRCIVTYASDLVFAAVSVYPHRRRVLRISCVSLDHSMWFHRTVKADEWLLFVITSPCSDNGRGFVTGQMFNRKGQIVVSLTQETLIREVKVPNPAQVSKL
ncbi:hypothetical protein ACFE04_026648 [Oxalis oulophora]